MYTIFTRVATTLPSLLILAACAMQPSKAPEETWIDVRTPAEYAASSISGHANIPHTEIAERITALVPDKGAALFLYCGSGRRAGLAKEALEQLGYTNVINAGSIHDAREELGLKARE